jgi:hypothetical protein
MKATRPPSALKPLDLARASLWAPPIFVQVYRAHGASEELVPVPAGSMSPTGEPGTGYTAQEVLQLQPKLLELRGPGRYTFTVADAQGQGDTWSIVLGVPGQVPQQPMPPVVPLGAGTQAPQNPQQFWPQQPLWTGTWAPPGMQNQQPWAGPQPHGWWSPWGQPPQHQQPQNMIETLVTKLLNDKDSRDNPMPMVMMTVQAQQQAFEQQMRSFTAQMQQMLQMQQNAPKGMDLVALFEKLVPLLPILLPFLKRDNSQSDALLRMQGELDRIKVEEKQQRIVDSLQAKIDVLETKTRDGKNNDLLPLLQMLQSQHAEEMRRLDQRQAMMESRNPIQETVALMSALKPDSNPVIESMEKILNIALNLNQGGEPSTAATLIHAVEGGFSKLMEAKAAMATAQAMQQSMNQPVQRVVSQPAVLSGPPEQATSATQPAQPQVPPDVMELLKALTQLRVGALAFVQTNGAQGLSPVEVADKLHEIAGHLEQLGIEHELLAHYRSGCERLDNNHDPIEWWVILSHVIPQAPKEYQEAVVQRLIDLRRGGPESEQGAQDESESD